MKISKMTVGLALLLLAAPPAIANEDPDGYSLVHGDICAYGQYTNETPPIVDLASQRMWVTTSGGYYTDHFLVGEFTPDTQGGVWHFQGACDLIGKLRACLEDGGDVEDCVTSEP